MAKLSLEPLKQTLEARPQRERGLVLATLLAAIGYLWLMLLFDPLAARQQEARRRITTAEGQIAQQQARYREIQSSYTADPNAFARNRLADLQEETRQIDESLDAVYGQLIPPREMSFVLTSILRRETTLRLINLENVPAEVLFESEVDTAPLVGRADAGIAGPEAGRGLRVFKHGLVMDFAGSYLETLNYLKSLEELDSNFFWEELSFELDEHPNARIRLKIFTLSTQQGWIGV